MSAQSEKKVVLNGIEYCCKVFKKRSAADKYISKNKSKSIIYFRAHEYFVG